MSEVPCSSVAVNTSGHCVRNEPRPLPQSPTPLPPSTGITSTTTDLSAANIPMLAQLSLRNVDASKHLHAGNARARRRDTVCSVPVAQGRVSGLSKRDLSRPRWLVSTPPPPIPCRVYECSISTGTPPAHVRMHVTRRFAHTTFQRRTTSLLHTRA
jgi:hypothetical protein